MVRIHVGQPTSTALFMPFEKPIEGLSEEDLRALISSAVSDARILAFKRDLPRATPAGRLDFLSEIASFANGPGGFLLLGVTSREGSAAALSGVDRDAAGKTVAWLEQAASGGISPRIPGLRFQLINLENEKSVLLVRIPKTWAGPHMVTHGEANQFYSRNAQGKYLLDIGELRQAFSLGESLREKMRAFRLERINVILNRALSVQISDAPKTVLHLLPMASFQPGFRIDLDRVVTGAESMTRPMVARGLISHYNYDGLITFSSMEKYAYSYVQVLRNGCLEAAEGLLLEPRDGRKYFPSAQFEREVIQCGERLLSLLRRLEIDPPYVVMLSFLGVRGYGMFVGSMRWQSNAHQIERDHLFLDEIILEDANLDIARALRPAFDQVWNACGWPRSLNYDEHGNWREHAH